MERIAIYSYVEETVVPGYSNYATSGVDLVAREIMEELEGAFDHTIDLGPYTKKADIIQSLQYAAQSLDPLGGLCFFYFHGHGDSILGQGIDDETLDQVLVCADSLLLDDDLSSILQEFKSTHRIFSIVDSCSSGTVIEWPEGDNQSTPKIIHLASAWDQEEAYATSRGGIFSNRMLDVIHNYGYTNETYNSFVTELKNRRFSGKICLKTTDNITHEDLETELFI